MHGRPSPRSAGQPPGGALLLSCWVPPSASCSAPISCTTPTAEPKTSAKSGVRPRVPPGHRRHYGAVLGGLHLAEVGLALLATLPRFLRIRPLSALAPAKDSGRRFVTWALRPDCPAESRVHGASAVFWPWQGFSGGRMPFGSWRHSHCGVSPCPCSTTPTTTARLPVIPWWRATTAWRPASPAPSCTSIPHATHYHPSAPWSALPALAAAAGDPWEGGYWSRALEQLRGPIRRSHLPRGGR